MLSRNQTTQVDDVNYINSFTQTNSERLSRAKQQQAANEQAQYRQDLKMIGWVLIAAFIGLLIGLAI